MNGERALILGMMNMPEPDGGRYAIRAYRYKPRDERVLAHLQLDIQVGVDPTYSKGVYDVEPRVHYAAVDIYGDLAETLYLTLSSENQADMVRREEYEE